MAAGMVYSTSSCFSPGAIGAMTMHRVALEPDRLGADLASDRPDARIDHPARQRARQVGAIAAPAHHRLGAAVPEHEQVDDPAVAGRARAAEDEKASAGLGRPRARGVGDEQGERCRSPPDSIREAAR